MPRHARKVRLRDIFEQNVVGNPEYGPQQKSYRVPVVSVCQMTLLLQVPKQDPSPKNKDYKSSASPGKVQKDTVIVISGMQRLWKSS